MTVYTTSVEPRRSRTDWIFRESGYFYSLYDSQFFGDPRGDAERKASVDRAGAAQFRIFSAWPLVLFGGDRAAHLPAVDHRPLDPRPGIELIVQTVVIALCSRWWSRSCWALPRPRTRWWCWG